MSKKKEEEKKINSEPEAKEINHNFFILEEQLPSEIIEAGTPLEYYDDEEVEEPPLILDLALEMLSSDIEDERVRAVHFVQENKSVEAIPILLARLEVEPLDRVRSFIYELLGEMGTKELTPKMLSYLSIEEVNDSKRYLVRSLGILQDERAIDPLLEIIQYSPDIALRKEAAQALSHYPLTTVFSRLEDRFSEETDILLLITLAESLITINIKESIPYIIQVYIRALTSVPAPSTGVLAKKIHMRCDDLMEVLVAYYLNELIPDLEKDFKILLNLREVLENATYLRGKWWTELKLTPIAERFGYKEVTHFFNSLIGI
ncbi:MAG: HEAT repeat domain-containing protein [Candidatus Kariarchaeaceae archaeon]